MSEPSDASAEIPAEAEGAARQEKSVVVRYGRMGQVGLFSHELESAPVPGSTLVVRTERGTELGSVLTSVGPPPCRWGVGTEALENYIRACGPDYPFARGGRVLRPASVQDLNDQQHLDGSTREAAAYCREQVAQLGLKMRLVDVEHLLGGERIVFYFTSEQRVDFRELVRRLAGRYHTRIEMRQVGARDEARLVADYERCGRRCCCREYLKFLKPVSMKMAKTQKATLDPSKISGRCGRLMCCLRYEDQTYEELLLRLPRRNAWVRTAAGLTGRVAEVQVLTQLVRLTLPDTRALVVANEEIVERDLPAPAGGPLAGAPEASGPGVAGPGPSSPMGRERQPRQDSQPSAADDQAPASRAGDRPEGQSDQSRPAEPAAEGAFPSTVPSPPAPGRADVPDQRALPPGRRRRRRRRQRKGGQPPARPTPTDAGPAGGGPAAGPQADQDRSRPRGEDTSQRLTSPGDPA